MFVECRGVACVGVGGGGGVTPPTFTELVGKTRSRSVMTEAVGENRSVKLVLKV